MAIKNSQGLTYEEALQLHQSGKIRPRADGGTGPIMWSDFYTNLGIPMPTSGKESDFITGLESHQSQLSTQTVQSQYQVGGFGAQPGVTYNKNTMTPYVSPSTAPSTTAPSITTSQAQQATQANPTYSIAAVPQSQPQNTTASGATSPQYQSGMYYINGFGNKTPIVSQADFDNLVNSGFTPLTSSGQPVTGSTQGGAGVSTGTANPNVDYSNYGGTRDANGDWVFADGSRITSGGQVFNSAGGAGNGGSGDGSYAPTGNPELDAILQEMQKYLDNLTASGQVVNPAIELSPEMIQQFLDQAESEISPYYAGQIRAIKGDLSANLQYLQQQYGLEKQAEEAKLKSNLGSYREQAAGAGLAFSGGRGQQEGEYIAGTNRQLQLQPSNNWVHAMSPTCSVTVISNNR